MTKTEFLTALERHLKQLPKKELEKQLAYYGEMLEDRMEDGLPEAEAVAQMGPPEELAQSILQDQSLGRLIRGRIRPRRGWGILQVILLILGSPIWLPIALALFCVMLSVYIVLWAGILVLFSAVLAIGIGGLALLVVACMNFGTNLPLALLLLGGGLACLGLCIFAFLGASAVSKGLARLSLRFARWIKSLFILKEEAA